VSNSRPCHFIPRDSFPSTLWVGSWCGRGGGQVQSHDYILCLFSRDWASPLLISTLNSLIWKSLYLWLLRGVVNICPLCSLCSTQNVKGKTKIGEKSWSTVCFDGRTKESQAISTVKPETVNSSVTKRTRAWAGHVFTRHFTHNKLITYHTRPCEYHHSACLNINVSYISLHFVTKPSYS